MNKNVVNLYIDESGNTGEIKIQNNKFNFDSKQKDYYFSNCLILIKKWFRKTKFNWKI